MNDDSAQGTMEQSLNCTAVSNLEWYRTGRLAPYMLASASVGGVSMLEVAQPAGDMSDPPVSDLVLVQTLSNGVSHQSDYGAGRFCECAPRSALYLVPPWSATNIQVHDEHAIRSFCFSVRHYCDLVSDLMPGASPFDFGRLHRGHFRSELILPLLERMWSVSRSCESESRLFFESASLVVLFELSRLAEQTNVVNRGGLTPSVLKRVTDYLMAHLAEDVALADLAVIAGLSPHHFCRAFKQSTGLPPHAWLTQRRIERAQDIMVAHPSMGLPEIALCVGYQSQTAFGAAFKRVTGDTPSRWRRKTVE